MSDDDSLVVVDVDGRADLYHLDPVSTYQGAKLPDGTIVLRPLDGPGHFARRFEPRPLDEPTEEDYAAAAAAREAGEYAPGVTIRPIYADEWRQLGLD